MTPRIAWAALALMLALVPTAIAQSEPDAPACDVEAGDGCGDPEPMPYCGAEMCAYDCIECSGMPEPALYGNETASCMDGTATDCDPDVQYFGGRGPEDCENCRDLEDGAADLNDKPASALGVGLWAVALGFLALVRRHA